MEKIREILVDIRPEFDFKGEEDFIESGYLDSFDLVLLTSQLEENFNIKIKGNDIVPENFNNLENIYKLIKNSETK